MPAKPKTPTKSSTEAASSKTAKKKAGSAAESQSGGGTAESASREAAPKKSATITELRAGGTLDLLEEKPKKSRRSGEAPAKTAMPAFGARSAKTATAEPADAPAEPKASQLDEQKKNALSLFEEQEKKQERVRTRQTKKEEAPPPPQAQGKVLPAISRILQEKEEKKEADKAALLATFQQKSHSTAGESTAPAEAEAPPTAEEPVLGSDEPAASEDPRVIHLKPPIVVRELAERMGLKGFKLVKDLMEMDIFVNQNQSIEPEVVARICEKHGFIFEREKREKGAGIHKEEKVIEEPPPVVEQKVEEMLSRPPIITVMGHVDHGKTSLLDAIRKTRVAAGEAGGITQHIGAYSVQHNNRLVTFLDTPGHAAFTQMRARGANLTDIVILVVAADDGLMPQTLESIAHAQAAKVPIVVAMNKIDLRTADPNRVMAQLQEKGLAPEEWGGTTQVVPVSALKGTGIDDLLERALLEAELLELRANPSAPCRAVVIESRIEPGKGPTATVIPQTGTLHTGMSFICGPHFGKVKNMLNDRGQPVKEAGPAIPVEVIGFSDLPNVGDELVAMDDREAKKLSEQRISEQRLEKLAAPRSRATLETLFAHIAEGEKLAMKVILKSDVQGSLEAIVGQLNDIKSDKIKLEIIHSAVGPISENDVLLASASDAIIIGFNTKVEGKAVKTAKAEGVQIKLYSIIYELFDQVKEAMLGMLAPETREKILGHALVKQVFKVSKGRVGGCQVSDGRILRGARARVLRGKEKVPVYDGGFHTLRRFTEDVTEVRNGLECGIRLGDFNDYEPGDVIECYELEKIAQSL